MWPVLVLSLGLRSLRPTPFFLSLSIVSRIRGRSSLSLSFSLQEYACRSVPPNLFAREIFLRVVHRKRVLTRDPPRRITCNGTIFSGDFRSLIFLFAQTHSRCLNFNSVQIDWEYNVLIFAEERLVSSASRFSAGWTVRLFDLKSHDDPCRQVWEIYWRCIFRIHRKMPSRAK